MSKISNSTVIAYNQQYERALKQIPDGTVIIENGEDMYVQPEDETDATFLDRLERSKKAGKNLFLEEWKEFHYKEGALY